MQTALINSFFSSRACYRAGNFFIHPWDSCKTTPTKITSTVLSILANGITLGSCYAFFRCTERKWNKQESSRLGGESQKASQTGINILSSPPNRSPLPLQEIKGPATENLSPLMEAFPKEPQETIPAVSLEELPLPDTTAIDPQAELERGMVIPQAAIDEVQNLLPKITSGTDNDSIEWLSRGKTNVFRLKNHPTFVFKLLGKAFHKRNGAECGQRERNFRFDAMVQAMTVLLQKNLQHLIIPHACKLDIPSETYDTRYFIVEQSIPIAATDYQQEVLYHQHSKALNEPLRELAILTGEIGLYDITHRNIPIYQNKIVLVDLEYTDSVTQGFCGDLECPGILGCVTSKEQLEIVMNEARKYNIPAKELQQRYDEVLRNLTTIESLPYCYKIHGIETGKEPIDESLDSLELNLDQADATSTPTVFMRTVVQSVIKEINDQIQANASHPLVWKKRRVWLTAASLPLQRYGSLGTSPGNQDNGWITQILAALKASGRIFQVIPNPLFGGFQIQA